MNDPSIANEISDDLSTSRDCNAVRMHDDAREGADEDAQIVQQGGVLRSGVDARKAAQMRWSKHRERQTADSESAEGEAAHSVLIVRVTVETGDIIKRLSKDAKAGNVQAARELRGWLNEVVVERETDISDLDERTRQSLLALLLALIETTERTGVPIPELIEAMRQHVEAAGGAREALMAPVVLEL